MFAGAMRISIKREGEIAQSSLTLFAEYIDGMQRSREYAGLESIPMETRKRCRGDFNLV